MARRCDVHHKTHGPLLNGTAKEAAIYTVPFVDALLRGMRKHLSFMHFPIFHMEDTWDWRHGELCCRHFEPRQALALPTECPFDLSMVNFTGKRSTILMFVNGRQQLLDDDFKLSPTSWKDETKWTGFTYFQVVQPIMLPQAMIDWASHLAKASSHCLHAYVHDEAAFQAEWQLLFPTRGVLGSRRGRSERAAAAAAAEAIADEAETAYDMDAVEAAGDSERLVAEAGGQEEDDEAQVARELREIPINEESFEKDGQGYADESPPLAPALRRELYRVHRNLGHPDQPTFLRALRHAGAKSEVLDYAKRGFRCPICIRRQRPQPQRPAHLQRVMPFNEVVGVDLIFVKRRPLLNCLCWGTSLQWVETLDNKTASEVTRAFMSSWVARYGAPRLVVADRGSEFTGSPFPEVLGENGILLHLISVRAPWENARTERAGGWFKSKLETVIDETSALNENDFQIAVAETVAAHNQHYDRSGFTPNQRVCGTSLRLPPSLLNDDFIRDEFRLQEPQTDFMKRAQEIRAAAQQAWIRHQDNQAVSKALRSNTRTSDATDFAEGQVVYVFRETADYKGWVGPGVVIAASGNGRALWISLRGFLVKAAKEQVRAASAEEHLGVELVKALSTEMLEKLESGKLRNFQDLEAEFNEDSMRDYLKETEGVAENHAPDEAPLAQIPLDEPPPLPEVPPQGEVEVPDELMIPAERPEEPAASTRAPSDRDTQSAEIADVESTVPSMPSRPSATTPLASPPWSRRTSEIRVDEASGGWTPFGPARTTTDRPRPYPWPAANHMSSYMEMAVPECEGKGAAWWRNKSYDRWEPVAVSKDVFHHADAFAYFNLHDKRFYVTKQKLSPGQVEFRDLGPAEKEVFRKARKKEVDSLLETGAIRILSLAESRKFEKENPNHVLTSRYVDRYKPKEEYQVIPDDFDATRDRATVTAEYAPKSRWTVVGWKDPHIHEIERSAPTPLTSSIYLFFQLAATRQWMAGVRDAKTAFLQSKPTSRQQKLACRMPSDEHFEGYDKNQLVMLETEVYGLVSGPAWWRRSLLEIVVKDLGYRVNVYDRCILTLDDEPGNAKEQPGRTQGIILVEVDDLLEAGGPRHRQKMDELTKRLRFGKAVTLVDHPEGAAYAGRRIMQSPQGDFKFTMADYIQNRLKRVVFDRRILKKNADQVVLNEGEQTQLRGVLAAINWTSREGRPDVSAAASILASKFPDPTASVALDANKVVEHLKSNHVVIRIHAIPEDAIRHVLISDSSCDPKGTAKPQHGWILAMSTPALNKGLEAPVSIIGWCSRKLRRKATSSLLSEAVATSTAMGSLEKQVAMWESLTKSRFDPKDMSVDIEISMGLRGSATVIASEGRNYVDPKCVVLVDAKSLFDAASSEQARGEDERSAIEIAIIQESLAKVQGRMRWIPHNFNPADGLTKLEGAHLEPLMQLLKTGRMIIQQEDDILSQGKQSTRRLKLGAAA